MTKKIKKRKFDIIPKTNEEYISVTYGCLRLIDIYGSLSSSLDSFVKTLVDNSPRLHKNLNKKLVKYNILNLLHEKEEEEDRTIGDI